MSAFNDLLDLQTAVVEQVKRPDIVDVFPRLVALAEVTFNRRLRLRQQITAATVTLASGSASLPVNFLEAIGLYNAAGFEYVQQPLQSAGRLWAPDNYAISGGQIIAIGDGARVLSYYAKVPSLSGSPTATSWLLEDHPGLYLYGVGLEAAKYIRDVEGAQAASQLVDAEFAAVATFDSQQRYSRARVRVAGVTP